MTTAFEQLLYIYGDAISGRRTVLPENCDRNAIAKKAMQQNILPIVYFNLFGEETDNPYYPLVMQAIANNERKMFFLGKLLQEMEEENIKCCVLKGSSLAPLYASPELRISGDIDLLIFQTDEKRMVKFLEKRNFEIKKRLRGSQHFEAIHKKAGMYEIHVSLFDREFDKYILQGKFKVNDSFEKMVTSEGNTINVLSKNDGLYFVTAHMIKHFVKDGLGLRQISDWLLYIKRNSEELNLEKYNDIIQELEFDKFINAMYTVGKKYFAIDMEKEEISPEDILSDMEEGGSFGHGDKERAKYKLRLLDSIYKKRKSTKRINFISKMLRIAFPDKRTLIQKGILKEGSNFIMVPFGWFKRWLKIVFSGKLEKINTVAGKSPINEEKLEKRQRILNKYRFTKK